MREYCTPGSVRGVRGNAYPYRNPKRIKQDAPPEVGGNDTAPLERSTQRGD